VAGARKASSKPAKSLEATLWDAADKLRGNLEASEYKHVVLGLVFLKYVSDAFTARRLELETALADPDSDDHIPSQARRERILESRDEYTSHNVFWVPPRARWEHLIDNAKQPGTCPTRYPTRPTWASRAPRSSPPIARPAAVFGDYIDVYDLTPRRRRNRPYRPLSCTRRMILPCVSGGYYADLLP
jgi:type I restriction-modification system DNA methylase subunit